MIDSLVICRRCGSDACYQTQHDNSIHWQCIDCGFYTNTYMLKNSEVVNYLKETSPELYKDLAFEDEHEFIWWPKVINVSTVGIIFIDGSSKEDWSWCFAPEVLIPEEQRFKYPIKDKPGEFHTHRVDMNLKKNYSQLDFILALQDSGLLLNQFT